MITLISSVLSIIILYFLAAWLRPLLGRLFGFRPCAICAAVSITWLALLPLWFLGKEVDLLVVALLVGGSIVGLMYRAEKKLGSGGYFWLLRLLLIVGGISAVYLFLREVWLWFIIVSFVFIFLLLWVYLASFNKKQPGSGELQKKLEHCCD